MRSLTRVLVVLLCLVVSAQQAAARVIPACEHADSAAFEAAMSDTSHDHHAMHAGATGAPDARSAEPAGDCECGCPCAIGACLHASVAAAVLPALAVSGLRFASELPSFADAAHAPAAAAVAFRPPIPA